ncbi:hypothetical protein SAMN02745687_02054 [Lachnospiraceae bacterium NK3A20]|nr:hypothetical protein SAMN02745687_02054 [Lachnospiraceae bacterium NK3A20]
MPVCWQDFSSVGPSGRSPFGTPAFLVYGKEAGLLAVFVLILSCVKHWPAIRTIPAGTCEKTDVVAAIRKKFLHK